MPDETKGMENKGTGSISGGYGKKPTWMWLLLYLVIGGIVYYVVYVAFIKKDSGYNAGTGTGSNASGLYDYGN